MAPAGVGRYEHLGRSVNPLVLPLFELAKQVLGGLGLDPEAKERAQRQAFELLTQGDFAQRSDVQMALAQIAVNKAEAEAPGIFKGGWRPFIGWVCGVSCAWNWLGLPVSMFACRLAGLTIEMAPASLGEMMPVLLGLLGLGTLRTVERIQGKA